MHKTITFIALEKLSNNNKHIESLSVEIIWKNQKNIILSCIYWPPRGDPNIFTNKIKELTEGNKQKQKPLVLIGDLNLNSLDYDKSTYENYENKWNGNRSHTYEYYIRIRSSQWNNKEWYKWPFWYFLCVKDRFRKKAIMNTFYKEMQTKVM